MTRSPNGRTVAKSAEINFVLWATIVFFGLLPVALGASLGVAQYFHLVH